MKRRHNGYILVALLLTLCSQVVLYISVTSESWVVTVNPQSCCGSVFLIYCGLFRGSIVQLSKNSMVEHSNLSLTCLFNQNVCAWSCQTQETDRTAEIAALYNSSKFPSPCIINSQCEISIEGGCEVKTSPPQIRESFLNGITWLIKIATISLSAIIGLVGSILTAYNINHIPSSYFVSIRGLYFWYYASSTVAVLTLIVWALEFVMKLSKNIGTVDTIIGLVNTYGKSYLGYSYWCQLGVVVLQLSCAVLLHHRENLFDRQSMFVSSLDTQRRTLAVSNIYC